MLRILLFSCALFLSFNSNAQTDVGVLGKSLYQLKQPLVEQIFSSPHFLPSVNTFSSIIPPKQSPTPLLTNAFSVSDSYYEHLGFFCKVELRLEQQSKFPIKFRLGEVQYVERLEGKY